jgi:hypothetical protein
MMVARGSSPQMWLSSFLEGAGQYLRLSEGWKVNWFAFYWALAALIASLVALTNGEPIVLFISMSFIAWAVIGVVWFQFVGLVKLQSERKSVVLTPHLRRTMMVMTLAGWLAASALAAVLLTGQEWYWAVFGLLLGAAAVRNLRFRWVAILAVAAMLLALHIGGIANLIPSGNPLLLPDPSRSNFDKWGDLLFVHATALGLVGTIRVYPILGFAIATAWFTLPAFSVQLFGVSFAHLTNRFSDATSQPFAGCIFPLMLFGIMFYGLFWHQSRGSISSKTRGAGMSAGRYGKINFLTQPFRKLSPYGRWLDKVVSQPSSFGARLGLAFGPGVHWTCACIVLPAIVVFGYFDMSRSSPQIVIESAASYFMWTAPMSGYLLGMFYGTTSVVRSTFQAQRLLSLSPGWHRDQLNPALAGVFARGCFAFWLVGMLGLAAIFFGLRSNVGAWLQCVTVYTSTALLAFAGMLHRYDVASPDKLHLPHAAWLAAPVFPLAAYAVYNLFAIESLRRRLHAGEFSSAAAFESAWWARYDEFGLYFMLALLSAAVAAWRLRAFLRSPPVLPAGRNSA